MGGRGTAPAVRTVGRPTGAARDTLAGALPRSRIPRRSPCSSRPEHQRPRARLDYIKLWLAERAPDVVGFQELKMEDGKFPREEFEALGYRCVTHGQKSWNGVAILWVCRSSTSSRAFPSGGLRSATDPRAGRRGRRDRRLHDALLP